MRMSRVIDRICPEADLRVLLRPAADLLWRKDITEIAGEIEVLVDLPPMYASRGWKLALHEQRREDMASAIPTFL